MKGRTQRLLIERIDAKGIARGYGENYIPIQVSGKSLNKNTFINVTLNEIENQKNEEKMVFNSLIWKKILK